jgi:hypothetical protein
MKVFHCDHCDHLVFFENTSCVSCQRRLAFLPEVLDVGSLDQVDQDHWVSPLTSGAGRRYRLCRNYVDSQVCNWAIDAKDDDPLCVSCRLTRVIPDLAIPGHRESWYRLEVAKRRVLYTLLQLGLPLEPVPSGPPALVFEFLADPVDEGSPILTGHSGGVVTINIAEADDAEREKRRKALGEPYRTLLGHLRHEIGHYYWTRLVDGREELERFRRLFGDEREEYAAALARHYQQGPPADWQDQFVTAYASAHPWEDWAETWAHYLHMSDTLETAAACGLSLRPTRQGEPALPRVPSSVVAPSAPFDRLINSWHPVTYVLNNLNRGMGLADAYPFVLAPPAIEKLRFVHEVLADAGHVGRVPLDPADKPSMGHRVHERVDPEGVAGH